MTKTSDRNTAATAAAASPVPPTVSMKQANTFPFRLHDMLDTVVKEGSEHVVSWIPGNDIAFKVHKPSVFVESIMPRFFSQSKYKVRYFGGLRRCWSGSFENDLREAANMLDLVL